MLPLKKKQSAELGYYKQAAQEDAQSNNHFKEQSALAEPIIPHAVNYSALSIEDHANVSSKNNGPTTMLSRAESGQKISLRLRTPGTTTRDGQISKTVLTSMRTASDAKIPATIKSTRANTNSMLFSVTKEDADTFNNTLDNCSKSLRRINIKCQKSARNQHARRTNLA